MAKDLNRYNTIWRLKEKTDEEYKSNHKKT